MVEAIKLACELPKERGRALSFWDCKEIGRQLVAEQFVSSVSPQTIGRRLQQDRLKPWRMHYWLSSKAPRDAAYAAATRAIADLYTCTLGPHEVVISVDEITNLQPRPRPTATKPARPGRPAQVEHGYDRGGALNLIAAFDTRKGTVLGITRERKRAEEFIELLELLEKTYPPEITAIYVVLDNLRVHKGKKVAAWLAKHRRFVFRFPPVHCSWMNQIEQWFSILQRKALRLRDFTDLSALAEHIHAFIKEWNCRPHPFAWTRPSFDKALAKCPPPTPSAGTPN
jgi:transposase